MKPITFCINTSKNEKDYVLLLLKSLKENTNLDIHEVLIFIDSDNQNTYESLLEEKQHIKDLKIYRNINDPVGYQRNVSILIHNAKNNIVCYLQSDMVVSNQFDVYINNNIKDNTILTFTRVEPPLHGISPEVIVENFGLTPNEFKYDDFITFTNNQKNKKEKNTNNHIGPLATFATTKEVWINKLKSFDTQFRCSREDSDLIVRCGLNNIEIIQSWEALVYHFTCVSSRGIDWFKNNNEGNYKKELQNLADNQELKRFVRKWGTFGHSINFKYNVSLVIDLDRYVDLELLKSIEPFFNKLYINNLEILNVLKHNIEFDYKYYSNLRFNFKDSYWESVKHLYNPTNFNERLLLYNELTDVNDDIIFNIKYSDFIKNLNEYTNIFQQLGVLLNEYEEGEYEFINLKIKINKLENQIDKLKELENNIFKCDDLSKYKFL